MFKSVSLMAALAALALTGAAQAQTAGQSRIGVPAKTEICLDVNGGRLPVVCKMSGGRLDQREDICTCPAGVRTAVSVCQPGQEAPAENVALNAVRREAARDGSLIGDLFEGRPICVAPRAG